MPRNAKNKKQKRMKNEWINWMNECAATVHPKESSDLHGGLLRLWIILMLLMLLLIAMMRMTKILPWMNINENDKMTTTTTVNLSI